ncbi:MAG: comEC/Rec2-related domain protein [Candidatus Xenolissoclinum pacificiensis L6]|uniref:ComEC/Rec2-related domain protein n=1 Tax=Candidatus Xenolissoclinum pacificiensis L6 TaxID=1401685 RepID=W2V034_9RICK|nr:MAG: comEC/Rec2-related domain protein [Candidatus Xenolissoclinum pacificiensis L6]
MKLYQRHHLRKWCPIYLIIGISCFFGLTKDPPAQAIIYLITICIFIIPFETKNKITYKICTALFFIILGFCIAFFRTYTSTYYSMESSYHGNTYGVVKSIKKYEKKYSITIFNNKRKYNIKLSTLSIPDNLEVGDFIVVKAFLNIPQGPSHPNDYDFQRFAYFNNIGAIGKTTGTIHIIKKQNKKFFIENIRLKLYNHILSINHDNQIGEIISAIIIGKKYAIPQNILETFQHAGISHILAISGLHFVIVYQIIFLLVSKTLSIFTTIALNINIIKISTAITVIFGLAYLLLSGISISAQRAFLMILYFGITKIIDRNYNSKYSLASVATLLLIYRPEYILLPSFQMSFTAVMVLCSIRFSKDDKFTSLPVTKHIFNNMYSSCVVTLSLIPFTIYNFNSCSLASIVSNLFVIPILTFAIMPLSVLLLVFIKTPLGIWINKILSLSITLIIKVATYSAKLPFANITLKSMPSFIVLLLFLGIVSLCLIDRKKYGIFLLLIGIGLYMCYSTPSILINKKNVMIKHNNNDLFLIKNKKRLSYMEKSWLKHNGSTKYENTHIPKHLHQYHKNYSYHNIFFVYSPNTYIDQCSQYDWILLMNKHASINCSKNIIDIDNDSYFIKYGKLSCSNRHRIWNNHNITHKYHA